jgi:diacylglycerol O-acyltransferase / wax synthase
VEQLNTLDAGFLMAEDSDRNVSLAIGGIAIIEGPAPDYGEFKTVLAERIQTIPRCMQMLRTQPFDIGAPQWVDDPAFDIRRHVRRVAVPQPGDDAELFQVVADVLERRLDRDRPLWECWVIEGLKGNRWAILMKVHHCMADGISMTRILTRLCDEIDSDASVRPAVANRTAMRPHLKPVPDPNPPGNPLVNLWRTATGITNTVNRTVSGAAEIAGGMLRPGAGSSLVGHVTAMRRYRAVRVPLADVEQICRKFDVTVNDVALAAITEGYRCVLLHRGEKPRPDSLRTLVPVSVRSGDDALDKPGNRLSIMLPYLPVELDDPIQQLRTVHSRLTRTKQGGQRQAGNIVVSASGYVPFMFSSWMIRLLTRLPQRGIVTLATNVRGPHRRLEMMGQNVARLLPIPPIALQLRTGIAVMSYADDLVFGITADYDAGAADIDELADGIKIAVARLDMLSQDSILLFDRKSV